MVADSSIIPYAEHIVLLLPVKNFCLKKMPVRPAYNLRFFGHTTISLPDAGGLQISRKGVNLFMLDRVSLLLTIIGALNWLLVGLFQFDAVAWLCGGQTALVSRIIYSVVGVAGLWCISLLFREREPVTET